MLDSRAASPERGYSVAIHAAFPGVAWGVQNDAQWYPGTFVSPRNNSFQNSQWHLITGVRELSTVAIYMDGNLIERSAISSGLNVSGPFPLSLGTRFSVSSQSDWYLGDVDELRIYSRALAASEIAQLYTLNQLLQSVAIFGDNAIIEGNGKSYTSTGQYSGGISIDVSTGATWTISGTAPTGTYFSRNTLVAGSVSASTPITIKAQYTSGGVTKSATKAVTIVPKMSVSIEVTNALGGLNVNAQIGVRATVTGNSQPVQFYGWSVPGANQSGNTNATLGWASYSSNATFLIDVLVGDGVTTSSASLLLPIYKAAIAQEPVCAPAADVTISAGTVWNYNPAKKDNGLVVIIHGLWSTASSSWVSDMAAAIGSLLGSASPNVCFWDWSESARVRGDTLERDDTIRSEGRAQGELLSAWLSQRIQSGEVNPLAPIQLIGHSAGDPNNADSDADGVGDYEEVNLQGTNPLDTDSDGDGLSDSEEIAIGTSPTNRLDTFEFVQPVATTNWANPTIYWPSVSGKVYEVNRARTLTELRDNYETLTITNATPPTNSFTDLTATNGTYFYWLKVR